MAEQTNPIFRSIGEPLDVADEELDRFNATMGVPVMSRPRDADALQPGGPVARPEKLTIEVPGYLMDALRRDAVAGRTTVRHKVMLALRAAGFEIADADMIPDGRRSRTGRRPFA